MANFNGHNGRDSLPLFCARRNRQVFKIHDDENNSVKKLMARGRRRKGAFSEAARRQFREWWMRMRETIRAWDGNGLLHIPIPREVAPQLTPKVQMDLVQEARGLQPQKDIRVNLADFRVELY